MPSFKQLDTIVQIIWSINASLTVLVLGGPFWLQLFAAALVGIFWPSDGQE